MPSNSIPSSFHTLQMGAMSSVRSRKVNLLNCVCVESTAVGNIAASMPKEEMMGSATVKEHFPTQEMSWIVRILFIVIYKCLSSALIFLKLLTFADRYIIIQFGIIKIPKINNIYNTRLRFYAYIRS